MLVFEYKCKVKFKKNISYKIILEKINYFLDSALAKDHQFFQFHESKEYKYYVMDNPWPIEKDGIYKQEKIYTLRIRTVKQELVEYFSKVLSFHESQEMMGMGGELRIIPKKIFEEIYSLTPIVIKNDYGYWKGKISVSEFENRIKINLIKKYKKFVNKNIDENFALYDVIKFHNKKPIKISYKGINLLGDKINLKISNDSVAQELAYLAIGVGLGEMNSRSCGFMGYKYL